MSNNQQQALYVDLDVLLDTRLGTLAKIDEHAPTRVLSDNYHAREADWFAGVDMKEYARLYAARDVETLKRSMPTEGLALIRELIRVLMDQVTEMNSPYAGVIKVVVNTHPYHLTQGELDVLGRALAVRLAVPVPVELISLTPSELTPTHVKSHYAMLVMYEYDPWLSTHFDIDPAKQGMAQVHDKLMHSVTLFAPAIYYGQAPTKDEVKRLVKEAAHPLLLTETLIRTIIGLQLIDVAYFSIVRPMQRHTTSTPAEGSSRASAGVEDTLDA